MITLVLDQLKLTSYEAEKQAFSALKMYKQAYIKHFMSKEITTSTSDEVFLDKEIFLTKYFKTLSQVLLKYCFSRKSSKKKEGQDLITDEVKSKRVEGFILRHIEKHINAYIIKKGFINIDVVYNDEVIRPNLCPTYKNFNKLTNNCIYKTFSYLVDSLNCLLKFNEGVFHKHFSLMDMHYNFPFSNVVIIKNTNIDTFKKNNIRLFDVRFKDMWIKSLSQLVIKIYKHKHQFLLDENRDNLKNDDKKEFQMEFGQDFKSIVESVTSECFNLYEKAFPSFHEFSLFLGRYQTESYSHIDNVCQHFTNKSLEVLFLNQIFFLTYLPYLGKSLKDSKLLNSSFTVIDRNMLSFIEHNLKKCGTDKLNEDYFKEFIKSATNNNADNNNMPSYIRVTAHLVNRVKDISKESTKVIETSSKKGKSLSFSYLSNQYFYFTYELRKSLLKDLSAYFIISRYKHGKANQMGTVDIITDNDNKFLNSVTELTMFGNTNSAIVKREYEKKMRKQIKTIFGYIKMLGSVIENTCLSFNQTIKQMQEEFKSIKVDETVCLVKVGYFIVDLVSS